ncbi:MAG: cobD [Xanthobacteraceae bacterium]|nr:cobD [Xanthobacteraceae bacterium]
MTFGVAALALLIEAAFGYPAWLYRWIGHPVTWIGRLITLLDRHMNRDRDRADTRRFNGTMALIILLFCVGAPVFFIETRLYAVPFGDVVAALAASTLLAQRSLHAHVKRVAEGLEHSLEAGRIAVSHIVGRDPEALDEAGVARAAIESLAENFSDGIVAPALWTAVAGVTGGALYKAVNTADSMIGHRTPRYVDFGRTAARLDDFVNLPASRLAGTLIIAAAFLTPGASAHNAWRAMLADAGRHRSPNAGWPEAAMAGALGVALAGPRTYGGKVVQDHWMGRDGRRTANAADIRRALRIYHLADALLIVLVIAIVIVLL